MTNKQIKERLSRAVADSTPDVMESILLNCAQQKGAKQDMQTQTQAYTGNPNPVSAPAQAEVYPKRKKTWRPAILAAAMAAVLIMAVALPLVHSYFSVDSVIGIDVNPGIEIRTNRSEKVLSVTPVNDDAVKVLDGMNLKNVDLNVAVNALIGSMLKHGYVNEIKNSILITVENPNEQRSRELQTRLTGEISSLLNAGSVDGAVISQMVSEDERLRTLAAAHGISVGKAALVELLTVQDERLRFEDIAKLDINEINLLLSARHTSLQGVTVSGQANSGAYIGDERAKAAALAHAGLAESAVTFTRVGLDYDDGRMVYEVDFYTADADYEYEIDAVQGTVTSYDKYLRTRPTPLPPTVAYIGEEQAKTIALGHAGLTAASVTFIKASFDWDNGRAVYDVEFYSGNTEYDYEIDAVTGDIVEWDHDYDD